MTTTNQPTLTRSTLTERKTPIAQTVVDSPSREFTAVEMRTRPNDRDSNPESDCSMTVSFFDSDACGNHAEMGLHGVNGIRVYDGLQGPAIRITLVDGQSITIHTYKPTGSPDAIPFDDFRSKGV